MLSLFGKRGSASVDTSTLDTLDLSVMLADEDFKITHINPHLRSFFVTMEHELRQDMPQFSLATLVGQKIDIFHKHPSHQQNILRGMRGAHSATIKVGKHSFDLRISRLRINGTEKGYVVEWHNAATREAVESAKAQLEAISRSFAVAELDLNGNFTMANENFLQAFGYEWRELQGRPHTILVEPSQVDSKEYRSFWDSLRAGQFQKGRFKRIGKNGKIVWVEGTCNPVLNTAGKPRKFVKYVSDVSHHVELLSQLKESLDHSFGEIDMAVGQSTQEAKQAAAAVRQTAETVQSMAASAEELAASVREISGSMAKSRSVAEQAYELTREADGATQNLAERSRDMTRILEVIRGIAGQINLLALNATIESARAGDAGKGFAVVASEVKNLANQARAATDQISEEIDKLQSVSDDVVQKLAAIASAIDSVRDFVLGTASSVEEQSAVTGNMSTTMQQTAQSVAAINDNMQAIDTAVDLVSKAVSSTKQAATILSR
jgi:PAS domain S-box-containing protein